VACIDEARTGDHRGAVDFAIWVASLPTGLSPGKQWASKDAAVAVLLTVREERDGRASDAGDSDGGARDAQEHQRGPAPLPPGRQHAHPVFLGPCPTQAVACAVRDGVGRGGHVEVLANATPTEQVWR
jgi:hypothetical protein